MKQYDLLKTKIFSIENGNTKISNRIDGIFVGEKRTLLNFMLRQNSVRYVVFKSFLNAMEEINIDISPVNEKETTTFFIDLNEDKHDLNNSLYKIKCFDYAYFFDESSQCIFYANDDLEDVTMIIPPDIS